MKKQTPLKVAPISDNRLTIAMLVMLAIADLLGFAHLAQGAAQPAPVNVRGIAGATNFTNLYASGTLQADGIATFGSDVAITGVTTHTGNVTLNGSTTLGNPLIHSSESITPTNNGTITPTKTIVTLTPAGAVTITLGTCTTNTWTWLYNSVNANVVITDSGAAGANLAGNQTLTQYDTLGLVCISGNWVQLGAVSAN